MLLLTAKSLQLCPTLFDPIDSSPPGSPVPGHNGKKENDKTFRVFASKDQNDSYLGKQKTAGATIEKFGNTPDHCFIWNDSVNGVKVPDYLDKEYYIGLAKQRLEDFGIRQ